MQDSDVLNQIQRLVEEEKELRELGPERGLRPEDQNRLDAVEVSLDQCWDLLRRRRARREFGDDPNDAQVRDPVAVQRYQQ
jgi:hypothetical protein